MLCDVLGVPALLPANSRCPSLLLSNFCRPSVQLPLGPSLPKFLACFHAVNLPFCVLNAARLAAAAKGGGRAGGGGKDALFQRRKPAKLAWE